MTSGTINVSIVTYNRRDILKQVVEGLVETANCPYKIFVTDNGSTDGTGMTLTSLAMDYDLEYKLLPENVGIAKARNEHWGECIGHDTLRLDDKLLIKSREWPQIIRTQSEMRHSLISFIPPDQESLWNYAPTEDWLYFPANAPIGKRCGAGMYVPAELSEALGYWCEDYGLWGFEDIDYMDRAVLLGWNWGYTLRVEVETLARGNQQMKNVATEKYQPIYEANRVAYLEGNKDVYIEKEK